jgi:hypothetical protein
MGGQRAFLIGRLRARNGDLANMQFRNFLFADRSHGKHRPACKPQQMAITANAVLGTSKISVAFHLY